MALFEGLIQTDAGAAVDVARIGMTDYYVIDDAGFRRHVEAASVDRVVLGMFWQQMQDHRDEAALAMMKMMGSEDLFTKAAVDATLKNVDIEQALAQQLPPEARQLLGMLGFRVVVDYRGEIVRVDMPQAPEPDEE